MQRCQRLEFHPSVGKIPWNRKWQPAPVFLPGISNGPRSFLGYSPWSHKESDMTEHTNYIIMGQIGLLSYRELPKHSLVVGWILPYCWVGDISSVPIPSTSQGAFQNEFFGFYFSLLTTDSYCTDSHFLVLHCSSVLWHRLTFIAS